MHLERKCGAILVEFDNVKSLSVLKEGKCSSWTDDFPILFTFTRYAKLSPKELRNNNGLLFFGHLSVFPDESWPKIQATYLAKHLLGLKWDNSVPQCKMYDHLTTYSNSHLQALAACSVHNKRNMKLICLNFQMVIFTPHLDYFSLCIRAPKNVFGETLQSTGLCRTDAKEKETTIMPQNHITYLLCILGPLFSSICTVQ